MADAEAGGQAGLVRGEVKGLGGMKGHWWRRFVVRWIGGIYDVGPLSLMIHDSGFFIAWDRIVKYDFRYKL